MPETTFTFFDSDEAEKTALAGANGSGHLAPAAVLYAIDGTQLIGQKAEGASLPVVLPASQVTALTPPAAITGFATAANQTTELASLASILAKLSSDPATQTTLALILAKIISAPATEAKQDALNALIGEVQASPTSNTLLERLKAIQTALAGTLAVSGTVTANIGTVGTIATAVKQDTGNTSVASIDTKTPALGQALAAASTPVVLTAAQITTLTPPAAITGFATETTLAAASAKLPAALGQTTKSGSLSVALASNQDALPITDNSGSLTVDNGGTFAVQAAQSGTWNVTNVSGTVSLPTGAATAAKQPALGTAGTPSTDVITVQGATTGTALPIKAARSATATKSNVSGSASSGTILASNSARLGASIYNDSTAILYLDTSGGTASSTSHTLAMAANSYYELPFNLTGAITGIWASATGAARIVEYT